MIQSLNLGANENKLLLGLAEKRVSVFTLNEAQEILQTTNSSVKHILANLAKKRRLQRIEKGKYLLIPERADRELYWAESPWVVIPHLIDTYYVGFWTAMNYWGMIKQIPDTVFVATTKRKRNLEFGNQRFDFVTLSKKKFFGFIEEKASKTESFNISSKEKTIVDGLMHPEYCGGIPEVAKAMWNSREDVDWAIVLDMSKQVELSIVLRRLGYLLNLLEIEQDISEKLKESYKGYHFLDPNAVKKKIDYSKEYGLIINRTKNELFGWRDYIKRKQKSEEPEPKPEAPTEIKIEPTETELVPEQLLSQENSDQVIQALSGHSYDRLTNEELYVLLSAYNTQFIFYRNRKDAKKFISAVSERINSIRQKLEMRKKQGK